MPSQTYTFSTKVWLYPGKAGWHFITLPIETANEIQLQFSFVKKGFGSVPVTVTVGETTWKTSIFPDKKSGSYVMPLKKEIREKENIKQETVVEFKVEINV